jgi:hypothetical protein
MSLRPRLARVALNLTVLSVLAAAFAWQWRSRPDLSNWDEPRLARELEGLGYHVHLEPKDRPPVRGDDGRWRGTLAGLYACRDEPADWGEVANRPRTGRWFGCIVAVRGSHNSPPADPEYLALGPWQLYGDPAELDRIAGALGVPR